jgi:hypothetical protein
MDEKTTLATRPLHTGVALRSTDDAMGLATTLIKGGLLPKHIRNPADAVLIMLAGSELGLGPMASLRGIMLIEGRVALYAETMLAIVASRGVTFRWVESSELVATIEMQRAGFAPHKQTFTIEDAARAGLAGKGTWSKYPAAMLRARATSAACRAYCPDLLAGGGLYTPEEIESIETVEVSRAATVDAATVAVLVADLAAAVSADDVVACKGRARDMWRSLSAEDKSRVGDAIKLADARVTEAAGEGSCGDDATGGEHGE